MNNTPEIMKGNSFVDDRGTLYFINDLNIGEYKRFYIVENHAQNFIRAWHGHLKESKTVICVQGAALIGVVNIQEENQTPVKFTLSSHQPAALKIPAGYANGFKTLTADCKLMFLSTVTLNESKDDDFRFDYDHWNIWEESYR